MATKQTRKVDGFVNNLTDVHQRLLDVKASKVAGRAILVMGLWENKASYDAGETCICTERISVSFATAIDEAALDTHLLANDYSGGSTDN